MIEGAVVEVATPDTEEKDDARTADWLIEILEETDPTPRGALLLARLFRAVQRASAQRDAERDAKRDAKRDAERDAERDAKRDAERAAARAATLTGEGGCPTGSNAASSAVSWSTVTPARPIATSALRATVHSPPPPRCAMRDLTQEEREVEGVGLADGWERVPSPGHIVVFKRDDEHTHSELTYYRRDKDISIRVTEKSDNSYGYVSADFAGLLSVLNAVRLAVNEVATPTEEKDDARTAD